MVVVVDSMGIIRGIKRHILYFVKFVKILKASKVGQDLNKLKTKTDLFIILCYYVLELLSVTPKTHR